MDNFVRFGKADCRISYLTTIMKLRCSGRAPDGISPSQNHKMTHSVHIVCSVHVVVYLHYCAFVEIVLCEKSGKSNHRLVSIFEPLTLQMISRDNWPV